MSAAASIFLNNGLIESGSFGDHDLLTASTYRERDVSAGWVRWAVLPPTSSSACLPSRCCARGSELNSTVPSSSLSCPSYLHCSISPETSPIPIHIHIVILLPGVAARFRSCFLVSYRSIHQHTYASTSPSRPSVKSVSTNPTLPKEPFLTFQGFGTLTDRLKEVATFTSRLRRVAQRNCHRHA